MLFLGLSLATAALAQTEVSGEVSGEWTAEGSPYIVVDSTWVPEGDTLLLRAGVQVQFSEGQGLYVSGIVNATGEEEDSVSIRVAEGIEHWRGLRFYGRNQTQWDYASIICPDSAFVFDPGCSLTMNSSLVDADRTFAGDNRGIEGCSMSFSHSIIQSRSHHYALGSYLDANSTLFDFSDDDDDAPGFSGDCNVYRLSNCEIIGVLHNENGGFVVADSCRFLKPPNEWQRTGVALGGDGASMTNCYVEGGVSAGTLKSEQTIPLYHNLVLGSLHLSANIDLYDCEIRRIVHIDDGGDILIRNTVVKNSLTIMSSRSVIIDSCLFRTDSIPDRENLYVFAADNLMITRSVFNILIGVSDAESSFFDHNTFINEKDSLWGHVLTNDKSIWTNNIFYSLNPANQIFEAAPLPGTFKYNCLYGYSYAGGFENPYPLDTLDESNIFEDPLLRWEDNIPLLSDASPCIDSGDPDYMLDPDGTRTDIGAFFFNQTKSIHDWHSMNNPTDNEIIVFPNPFNSVFNISVKSKTKMPISLSLSDIAGRVFERYLIPYNTEVISQITINTCSLPSGRYFIKIQAGNSSGMVPVNCIK